MPLIEGHPVESLAPPLATLSRIGLPDRADEVAIRTADEALTWAELDRRAGNLCAAYLELGLRPGDRLASLMPNRVELAVHYLAALRAGLVLTPLNYRYTHREIDHALEVSEARMIVAHVERSEDLKRSERVPGLDLGVVFFADGDASGDGGDSRLESLISRPAAPPDLPDPDPGDPAAIFFTSGSTGPAKGVTHSHETLRRMVTSAAAAFELSADDTFLPASSMSHIGSFLWTLMTLSRGAKVVIARTFDAHELLPLLRDHEPTVMAILPAALSALIHDHDLEPRDFSCLRTCRAGSDAVSTELLTEFAELAGFPIDEGYGMTEVGLCTLNPPSGPIKQGSIGPPIPDYAVEVRDDDGSPTPAGTVGRIWIKTPARMVGYWNAEEATSEVISDGWLDSGDLAHADEDGYLWFFGRKKQVIVHDGSNISPLEVEGALLEHPAVALAGVVGIHDVVHGENVRAYVTLAEGVERPTAAELIEFARERVGYKAPEEIVVLDEMPLNPTGKIDRVGLKRMAEEHLHPHGLD